MNKSGLIKYILIILSFLCSIYFLATNFTEFGTNILFPIIFYVLIAIIIFIFIKRKKIAKSKAIYNIITIISIVLLASTLALYIYTKVSCYFSSSCLISFEMEKVAIYIILSVLMLLFCFKDIYSKTNSVNDILTVVTCLLIMFIYLRYYLDPGFAHNILNIDMKDVYKSSSYIYITQNYIYFSIMYVLILFHKLVNKK